jgi:hypothetical protein
MAVIALSLHMASGRISSLHLSSGIAHGTPGERVARRDECSNIASPEGRIRADHADWL